MPTFRFSWSRAAAVALASSVLIAVAACDLRAIEPDTVKEPIPTAVERQRLRVMVDLQEVVCHDEGDGWGSAEPYIWNVFFKIDGESVAVTEDLRLSGSAITQTISGSHGNLRDEVDGGEWLQLGPELGEFSTTVVPIPVPESVKATGRYDFPGIVGVVSVLMEEDNVSDGGAEAGHQELNLAILNALNHIIATRSFTNQGSTEEEIDALKAALSDEVGDAVSAQQSLFENVWSYLDKDDQIGSTVFYFDQDDIAHDGTIPLSARYENEGDWEVVGQITGAPVW